MCLSKNNTDMALVPKGYINAVVSIGVKQVKDTISWIGTGFFVIRKIKDKKQGKPYLISNKHVFDACKQAIIRMKEKGTENLKEVPLPLVDNEGNPIYICHPSADVAILPLNADFITSHNLEFPCFDIDDDAMTSEELLDNGVDEGSIIYMLGFPMGLVNNMSLLPICRMGCVARLCQQQIATDGNILVDIQNFPGNSGSPIITKPEVIALEGTKSLPKSILLGVVHSYIPYNENLINSQTNKIVEVRSENSGIANVHPVECIRELINQVQPKE